MERGKAEEAKARTPGQGVGAADGAGVEELEALNFRLNGFSMGDKLEPMKTTIDIPDDVLADAMRFTGAKTKREAVVKAMEDFNRARKVEALLKLAGSIPNFPTNDEIEAGDLAREKRLDALWNR